MSQLLDEFLGEVQGYNNPYLPPIVRDAGKVEQARAIWNDTWQRFNPTGSIVQGAFSALAGGKPMSEEKFYETYPKELYGVKWTEGMTDNQADLKVARKVSWSRDHEILESASHFNSWDDNATNFLVGLTASILDPVTLAISGGVAGAVAKGMGSKIYTASDRYARYKRLRELGGRSSFYSGPRYEELLRKARMSTWAFNGGFVKENLKPLIVSNFAASLALEPIIHTQNELSGLPYTEFESWANIAFGTAFGTAFPTLPAAVQRGIMVGSGVATGGLIFPTFAAGAIPIAGVFAAASPVVGTSTHFNFGGGMFERGQSVLKRMFNDPENMENRYKEEFISLLLGASVDDPTGLAKYFDNEQNLTNLAKLFGDSYDLMAKYLEDVQTHLGFENGKEVQHWMLQNHKSIQKRSKLISELMLRRNPDGELMHSGILDFGTDAQAREKLIAKNKKRAEELEDYVARLGDQLEEINAKLATGAVEGIDSRVEWKLKDQKRRLEANQKEAIDKISRLINTPEVDTNQIDILAQFMVKAKASLGLTVKLKSGGERVSILNYDEFMFVRTNEYRKKVGDWENDGASPLIMTDGEPAPFYIVDMSNDRLVLVKDPSMIEQGLRDDHRVFPHLRPEDIFEIDLNRIPEIRRAIKTGEVRKEEVLRMLNDPSWQSKMDKSIREVLSDMLKGNKYLDGLFINDKGEQSFVHYQSGVNITRINLATASDIAGMPRHHDPEGLLKEFDETWNKLIEIEEDALTKLIVEAESIDAEFMEFTGLQKGQLAQIELGKERLAQMQTFLDRIKSELVEEEGTNEYRDTLRDIAKELNIDFVQLDQGKDELIEYSEFLINSTADEIKSNEQNVGTGKVVDSEAKTARAEELKQKIADKQELIQNLQNQRNAPDRHIGDSMYKVFKPDDITPDQVGHILRTSQGLFKRIDGSRRIRNTKVTNPDHPSDGVTLYQMISNGEATSIWFPRIQEQVDMKWRGEKLNSYLSPENWIPFYGIEAMVGTFGEKSINQVKKDIGEDNYHGLMSLLTSWYSDAPLTNEAILFLDWRKNQINEQIKGPVHAKEVFGKGKTRTPIEDQGWLDIFNSQIKILDIFASSSDWKTKNRDIAEIIKGLRPDQTLPSDAEGRAAIKQIVHGYHSESFQRRQPTYLEPEIGDIKAISDGENSLLAQVVGVNRIFSNESWKSFQLPAQYQNKKGKWISFGKRFGDESIKTFGELKARNPDAFGFVMGSGRKRTELPIKETKDGIKAWGGVYKKGGTKKIRLSDGTEVDGYTYWRQLLDSFNDVGAGYKWIDVNESSIPKTLRHLYDKMSNDTITEIYNASLDTQAGQILSNAVSIFVKQNKERVNPDYLDVGLMLEESTVHPLMGTTEYTPPVEAGPGISMANAIQTAIMIARGDVKSVDDPLIETAGGIKELAYTEQTGRVRPVDPEKRTETGGTLDAEPTEMALGMDPDDLNNPDVQYIDPVQETQMDHAGGAKDLDPDVMRSIEQVIGIDPELGEIPIVQPETEAYGAWMNPADFVMLFMEMAPKLGDFGMEVPLQEAFWVKKAMDVKTGEVKKTRKVLVRNEEYWNDFTDRANLDPDFAMQQKSKGFEIQLEVLSDSQIKGEKPLTVNNAKGNKSLKDYTNLLSDPDKGKRKGAVIQSISESDAVVIVIPSKGKQNTVYRPEAVRRFQNDSKGKTKERKAINKLENGALSLLAAKFNNKPVYLVAGEWNQGSMTSRLDSELRAANIKTVHFVGDTKRIKKPTSNAEFDNTTLTTKDFENMEKTQSARLKLLKYQLDQERIEHREWLDLGEATHASKPDSKATKDLLDTIYRLEASLSKLKEQNWRRGLVGGRKRETTINKLKNNAFVLSEDPAYKGDAVLEYNNNNKPTTDQPENIIRYVRSEDGSDIRIVHLSFAKDSDKKIGQPLSANLKEIAVYDFNEYMRQRMGKRKSKNFEGLERIDNLPELKPLLDSINSSKERMVKIRRNSALRDQEFEAIMDESDFEFVAFDEAAKDASLKNMKRVIEEQARQKKKAIAYKLGDDVSLVMLNGERDITSFSEPLPLMDEPQRAQRNKNVASLLSNVMKEGIRRIQEESADTEPTPPKLATSDLSSSVDQGKSGGPANSETIIARDYEAELADIETPESLIRNNIETKENRHSASLHNVRIAKLKGNHNYWSGKWGYRFEKGEKGWFLTNDQALKTTEGGIHGPALIHIRKLLKEDIAYLNEYEATVGDKEGDKVVRLNALKERERIHDEIRAINNVMEKYSETGNQNFANFLIAYIAGGQQGVSSEAVSAGTLKTTHAYDFMAILLNSIEEAGLTEEWNTGVFKSEVHEAISGLDYNRDISHLPEKAVQIAKIVRNVGLIKLARLRSQGFDVTYQKGRISARRHSPNRMLAAGVKLSDRLKGADLPNQDTAKRIWARFLMSLNLNLERMFGVKSDTSGQWLIDANSSFGKFYSAQNKEHGIKVNKGKDAQTIPYDSKKQTLHEQYLMKIFENIIGSEESQESPFTNIDKLEKQTVIYFNDWQSELAYREEYGEGDWAENLMLELKSAGEAYGIAQVFGARASNNFRRITELYSKPIEEGMTSPNHLTNLSARGLPWLTPDHYFNTLMGYHNIPDPGFGTTLARGGSIIRGFTMMSQLGKMVISSLTDLASGDFVAKSHGVKHVSKLRWSLREMSKTPEGIKALKLLGVGAEAWLSSSNALKYGMNEHVPGMTGSMVRSFFKHVQANKWLQFNQESAIMMNGANLGINAKFKYADLDPALQMQLKRYGIFEAEWDVIRQGVKEIDSTTSGLMPFIFSDAVKLVDPDVVIAYSGSESPQAYKNAVKKLSELLSNFFIGEMDTSTVMPSVWEQTNATWGLNAGTAMGQVARFSMLYKTFPLAVQRKLWNRGMQTQRSTNSWVPVMQWVGTAMFWGFVAGSIKEILRNIGREQKEEDDHDLLRKMSIMLKESGSAGLIGDLILAGRHEKRDASTTDKIMSFMGGPVWDKVQAFTEGGLGTDYERRKLFHESLKALPYANAPFVDVILRDMAWGMSNDLMISLDPIQATKEHVLPAVTNRIKSNF